MNIGEKLYELRKEKNLSQEEVADKLNVTRQTVSKWETNQTTPDFDKIMPICELYGITTEELLTGKKKEKQDEQEQTKQDTPEETKEISREEIRRKNAQTVSTSVFIYILAIAFIMVAIPVLKINPVIASAIFLCIIAYATAKIIKNYMSNPKKEKTKEEKLQKQINEIVGTICTVLYFIISFATMAWHITWVIFIIDGLICEVVKLLFMLNNNGENNEEN